MDLEAKLDLLMSLAADDHEQGGEGNMAKLPPRLRNAKKAGILRPLNIRDVRVGAYGPRARLLRILMTNACSFNCHYCPMRRDRELPRTLLHPHEMVRIFLDALARGWASGLFLTTGIPGRPRKVMDDLIQVLELLRIKHRFQGYIHVKIIPGADEAQVERITSLATRVSINLETPCGDSLEVIAPEKRMKTTLVALQGAQKRVILTREGEQEGRPRDPTFPGGIAGITTQFVVGATPDPDRAILDRVTDLYSAGGMHHAHFSAFRPIRDTPMEEKEGTHPLREHRLYQADHLLRRYNFTREEIVFDGEGNLPLSHDPKLAWALANLDHFPLEVRTASYDELLRVPGVGPLTARRIVDGRRKALPRNLVDLGKIGVVTTRARGFLMLNGRRLSPERWREQLSLWAPEERAGVRGTIYEFSPGTFR